MKKKLETDKPLRRKIPIINYGGVVPMLDLRSLGPLELQETLQAIGDANGWNRKSDRKARATP